MSGISVMAAAGGLNSYSHAMLTRTAAIYGLASLLEIAGCFTFWSWLRLNRSAIWLLPGILSLVLFALCLAIVDAAHAGRAFAAYGGVYIAASLLWLWGVERVTPDRWDLGGAVVCLAGAALILLGPRS